MELKSGYKQTDVGAIPEDWDVKPLGELASLYQPVTISAKDLTEAGYPVYGANGVVGFYHSANHRSWQVTVTCRGSTCGTVNRTVDECWITGNAMVLNCDHHRGIHKDFFYFLMLGQDFSECITGTGQPQIVRSPLAAFRVAFPRALAEQHNLAEALSGVDALLGALHRLIAKKRDLKQAAMQQLLTGQTRLPGFHGEWEQATLGELFTFKNGLNKGKEYFGFGTPIVNYMDVFAHVGIHCSNLEGRVSLTQQEIKNFAVRKGDVLFTRTSETPAEIGMASVILDEPDQTVFSGFVLRGRPVSGRLCDPFKAYCFRTPFVRNQIVSKASYTTRALTNGRILSAVTLPLPTLPEQSAIAEVLTEMDAELAALERRREKTRTLKQAMMQELLTGRTRLI